MNETNKPGWEETVVGQAYHMKSFTSAEGEKFHILFCHCGMPVIKTIENTYTHRGRVKTNGSWHICAAGHTNDLHFNNEWGGVIPLPLEVKMALHEVTQ